jgi:hypothetical protein
MLDSDESYASFRANHEREREMDFATAVLSVLHFAREHNVDGVMPDELVSVASEKMPLLWWHIPTNDPAMVETAKQLGRGVMDYKGRPGWWWVQQRVGIPYPPRQAHVIDLLRTFNCIEVKDGKFYITDEGVAALEVSTKQNDHGLPHVARLESNDAKADRVAALVA